MAMRVLVLGSGGREHALAWALSRSPSVADVAVAPGNAGTAGTSGTGCRNVPIAALDAEHVIELAVRELVDLVVVGPEAPLVAGVVDALEALGIAAFGPRAAPARLEGSKAFLKEFATRNDIPTAPYRIVTDVGEADRYIDERARPQVVKADGLCGGKGAIVTSTAAEAKAAAARLLGGAFGDAGRTVVIEDRLDGVELSVHAISDGERFVVLPVARDHKRIGDGDRGPNTGGMGAFAPLTVAPALMERIEREVLAPTIAGMQKEGTPFRGVLYAGLMVGADGAPLLLEHNVRFGDPETQVLMALMGGDLGALLLSSARGELDRTALAPVAAHAAAVVLAAAGYPDEPRKGDVIHGLAEAGQVEGVTVFHAGTAQRGDDVVTAGGRVLGVTALGDSPRAARDRAYRAVDRIHWEGMQCRRDIAASAEDGR
jgi:phosphoribosylamine--glycine ligase